MFTAFKEYNDEKASLRYSQPSFVNYVEKAATIIKDF